VITNPHPPKVHITGMRVENKTVGINEKIYGKKILTGPMIDTRKIKIHHKIKVFTIEFAGLHYVSPENNQFQYKLEGYDDHWTAVDASVRFATYSKLPADDYVFKVKAANNNGLWSPEPAILEIKVKPPFWKTIPFYILVVIIVALAIVLFIKWREQQLQHDKDVLEAKLHKGEEEINKSRQEIEIQRQALEEKEKEEQKHNWFNSGLGKFSDILSNDKNTLEKLAQNLITNIVSYVEVDMGGLFLVNDSENEEEFLELVAHNAFNKEKLEARKYYPKEGQVGACYESNEIIQLDNLPQNYARLESGLGGCEMKHLLLLPILNDETKIGVLELISRRKIEEYKVEFLQKICKNIASVIAASNSNKLIKDMLEKTQLQAEQMKEQDEEMRQNIEEMQATQEESKRNEERLLKKIEELKKKVKKK
jgi:GAF domain-containing protein